MATKRKKCSIDRGQFCSRMEMTLDHEKCISTSTHWPTEGNSVIYDFGKRGYLEFAHCPYCGARLISTKVSRWRAKNQKRRA